MKQLWVLPSLLLLTLGATQGYTAEPLDATEVIARGEEQFRSLRDYECMVDVEVREGRKVEAGSGRYWFKQPRMLRVRILQGTGKGSEVAVDSEGQIRGHKRGILSFIVKRLKVSDRRLHTIRGTSMLELDWGSFYLRYRAAALRPDAVIAVAPRSDANAPYQVTVTYPDLGKTVREEYWIDPLRWVIVEGAVYEDEVRLEHVVFREIKVNTGIADGWFRL
jgi:outer membrane lipoprotein-sorting protein